MFIEDAAAEARPFLARLRAISSFIGTMERVRVMERIDGKCREPNAMKLD